MAKRKKKDPQPHFVNNVVIENKAQAIYNELIMSFGLDHAMTVLVESHKKCIAEMRRRAGLPKGS